MEPAACGAVAPDAHGPGSYFLGARRKEREEPEQLVARPDDAVEACFRESEVGEERGAVALVELGNLGLDRGADRDDRRPLRRRELLQRFQARVAGESAFVDVCHVHHRLRSQERKLADPLPLERIERHRAHRLALVEARADPLERVAPAHRVLVHGLRGFLGALARAVHGLEVGERELGVDDRNVRGRVDAARDVHDVRVLEAAHHVRDRVHLADVGQELVAEPLALRGAGDEARDVDELDRGRQDLFRLCDRRERREARVRHGHDADVRVDRAERVVLRRDSCARQRVEQRRLADVRHPDDSAADAHYCGAAGGAVCRRFIIFSAPSSSRRGNSAIASSIDSRMRRSSTALARSST